MEFLKVAIEGYIMTFEAAAKAYLESEQEEAAKEQAAKVLAAK